MVCFGSETIYLTCADDSRHDGDVLQNESARPGFALLRDRDFLALLRENLVLIRVWGLLKQACMPLFTKLKHDLDVISHSFELITMLWQASEWLQFFNPVRDFEGA